MPAEKPTPAELPSNDLILAAIERAICHRGRDLDSGVILRTIKDHLAIPHNGWTTQQLRPKLKALEAAKLIERSRRRGRDVWGLTDKGSGRLDAIRDGLTLPEAPQHQRWREARTAASDRIAQFRAEIRGTLDEAMELLEADREASSATWFELGDRLLHDCQRFATAIHCLREWPEPDDSTPDIDDPPYGQNGRRSTRSWDHA